MNLDDPSVYKGGDPGNMGSLIAEFPEHCATAWRMAVDSINLPMHYREPEQIVALGMGGSAIGADLVRGLCLDELPVPMEVVRSYEPPAYVGARTLVVASSHSGNTAETITAFEESARRSANLVAITTGGHLAERAKKANIPLISYRFPSQPRAALGYSFSSLRAVLHEVGLAPHAPEEILVAIEALRAQGNEYSVARPESTNRAKQLARRFQRRALIIYGAAWVVPVARRWKTQWNENAKQWAFFEELPELNHNAVEGYRLPSADPLSVAVASLETARYPSEICQRAAITRRALAARDVPCEAIRITGPNKLGELLNAVHLGDWVSYYLALLNGVDPTPVPTLDWLKAELGQ